MAQIKFGGLGLNRVSPPHMLISTQDGFSQFTELLNYIARDKRIKKIGGSESYNSTAISGASNIPWVHRSYHKRGDGTFRKKVFCFADGAIYSGNDVTGALTSRKSGFTPTAIPTHATMQVSGNSEMFVFIGEELSDEVHKYNGNGSFRFTKTSLNADLGRVIESGTIHLDRMWYVSKVSSTIAYSTTLKPEDLSTDAADIIVGQETDSVVRRLVVGADETLYVFKNQSIWRLSGRTPSTFQFRRVTGKYGLASKRSIIGVGSGFVFLDTFTKELYFFGGTESSIISLTERDIRLRDIIDPTQLENTDMTVHDGLFRFSFKHTDDSIYADRELIYPINEPVDGLPKWSMTKGGKILSYSTWTQQGDREELVTGRSDTGKLMYHNRTNNFDGVAIETIFRTAEIVASEDKVVRFKGFYVKAHPGVLGRTATFEYFLNERTRSPGSANLNMDGERRSLAGIKIVMQKLFNDRIIPLHASSLGNSISFRVSDSQINTSMEFYSIAFTAVPRYKIRNQLVST